jgi:hypothetical protein
MASPASALPRVRNLLKAGTVPRLQNPPEMPGNSLQPLVHVPPEVLARKSEHRTALRVWERLVLPPLPQGLSLQPMSLMTEPGGAAIAEIFSRMR